MTRVVLGICLGLLIGAYQSQARPPVPPDVFVAVRTYWHTRELRVQAFDIVACETGGRYNTTATNGQYENIFQMGEDERRRFGWHVAGSPAIKAARAAHRYWLVAGWRPWSCAYIVGVL